MKISVISDLHLDFANLALPGGEVLLLCGDAIEADSLQTMPGRRRSFFFEECKKYDRVYYILGNHEHYNGDFAQTKSVVERYLRGSNIRILDNESVSLNDSYDLFGATLWTDFYGSDWFAIQAAQRGMNDFYIVQNNGRKLTPQDTIDEHLKTLEKLQEFLSSTQKSVIIMTHHAPTLKVDQKYVGNPLNGAYHSNLEWRILNSPQIKYWFHGHMHDSFDYTVGQCRVICNPRGYVIKDRSENKFFNVNLTIDI